MPRDVGHWIRESRATKTHDRVEVFDDETSSRGAHWNSGIARGQHQRCPGIFEQALRDFYVGHTTLAAPGRFLPHDEWMNTTKLHLICTLH